MVPCWTGGTRKPDPMTQFLDPVQHSVCMLWIRGLWWVRKGWVACHGDRWGHRLRTRAQKGAGLDSMTTEPAVPVKHTTVRQLWVGEILSQKIERMSPRSRECCFEQRNIWWRRFQIILCFCNFLIAKPRVKHTREGPERIEAPCRPREVDTVCLASHQTGIITVME